MISPVSHGIVAFESITRSAGPDTAPSSDPRIGLGRLHTSMLTPSARAFSCCSVAWTDCSGGWEGECSARDGERGCVSESSMSPGELEVDFRGMLGCGAFRGVEVCTVREGNRELVGRSVNGVGESVGGEV